MRRLPLGGGAIRPRLARQACAAQGRVRHGLGTWPSAGRGRYVFERILVMEKRLGDPRE